MGKLTSILSQAGDPLLEEGLERFLSQARADFPEAVVPDADFIRYLAERLPEGPPLETLKQLQASDLYLACACAQGVEPAIELLLHRHGKAMEAAVRRVSASKVQAAEIVQGLNVKLFVAGEKPARIAGYLGRGPLRAWLVVAATRTALTALRASGRRREVLDDGMMADVLPAGDDPEVQHLRVQFAQEFKAAFREALEELDVRERNVLRYYVIDGLNIERIGKLHGVHRATVARWIAQTREKLLASTRSGLLTRIGARSSEVDSLIRALRSNVDLSILTFLHDQKA